VSPAEALAVKRAFDIVVAAVGLLLVAPLFLVVAALIKLDSRGPVFFRQERVGRGFRPFRIYKFRTMVQDASQRGGPLTSANDPRVTRVGRFLRKSKIDELPQLINVLKGEMSLVGPRPEVREYVELFRDDYREILKVRPGITDLASLKYRDEESWLAQWPDPDRAYVRHLLPDKIRLAKEYIETASFASDLHIIVRTLLKVATIEVSGAGAGK
jgi:lipopolysaccharide/colanic/teichoic acid biosynthesis glycosyltransferase